MTKSNKSDLFVITVVSRTLVEPHGPWQVTLRVDNLGVEPVYFDQVLENCFAFDRGVAMSGNTLVCLTGEKIEDLEAFCDKKADELLDSLKKHPLWDKLGSPDLTRVYNLHE